MSFNTCSLFVFGGLIISIVATGDKIHIGKLCVQTLHVNIMLKTARKLASFVASFIVGCVIDIGILYSLSNISKDTVLCMYM